MHDLDALLMLRPGTIEAQRAPNTYRFTLLEAFYGLILGMAIGWFVMMLGLSLGRAFPTDLRSLVIIAVSILLPVAFLALPIGGRTRIVAAIAGAIITAALVVLGSGLGGWVGP